MTLQDTNQTWDDIILDDECSSLNINNKESIKEYTNKENTNICYNFIYIIFGCFTCSYCFPYRKEETKSICANAYKECSFCKSECMCYKN